jgi:O-antigen ligase
VFGSAAALGGAYPAAALPIIAASAGAFIISGARVASRPETRTLDVALLSVLAVIAVQLVPLPEAVVDVLSPRADAVRTVLRLGHENAPPALTVDPLETRHALAIAAGAIFIFWAARETLSRGGVRLVTRAVIAGGFVLAAVAMAARVTSPRLLLWTWRPEDPGALPLGPFVNRNHFATWMLMGAALASGYAMAHLRTHLQHPRGYRLRLAAVLADGAALLMMAAIFAMTAGLVASASRSAALGAVTALAFGWWMSPRTAGNTAGPAVLLLAVIAAAGWAQSEQLLARLGTTQPAVGRPTIWRESLPVVRDFWLTGTGAGTYPRAMLQYQQTRSTFFFNTAHNEYLQVAAEGGLLLVVPVLVALGAGVRAARQTLGDRGTGLFWIRLGAAAGLVGALVQSVWETGLRIPANALLFALLAAIALHQRVHTNDRRHTD